MIISPKFAFEQQLVTNIANPEKQVGSDGIDLTLHSINRVDDSELRPAVLTENKKYTIHRSHTELTPIALTEDYKISSGYVLSPGVYDFTFNEGCNLKNGVAGLLLLRSTFVRNGNIGQCGLHDNGFETEHLGMMVHVTRQTIVEQGMRVAQIVLWESASAKEYDGTYNNQLGSSWQTVVTKHIAH